MSNILIIGETSFVATRTIEAFKDAIVPSLDRLDFTNADSTRKFVKESDVVINFAAYTNVKEATIDPNGLAWKLNVLGPANLSKICKEEDKFLIHISTDHVFPITDDYKGPHREDEVIVDDPKLFSAYGYTKLKGEMEVIKSEARAAILRISYPFGNASLPEKDYISKLIKAIKLGYPLFEDQKFTPTYINSLPGVIKKIADLELPGIFHWACSGLTTPYEIGVYINEKLKLGLEVKKGPVGTLPYAKFGGLSTKTTEEKLDLKPQTWKEAIDDFTDSTPQGLG